MQMLTGPLHRLLWGGGSNEYNTFPSVERGVEHEGSQTKGEAPGETTSHP